MPGIKRSDSLGSKLISGSVWMLAMRWSSRFMGLASMVIVARLLAPADFGIYAVATALIGLIEAFTEIGADIAIIRHPAPQRCHYDTAWTFKIILHAASALLIVLLSPLAIQLYGDERYAPVLNVIALSILVNGFTNIGIADFRRDLEFKKDFQFNVLVQFVGVLATLGLAFALRSYWALVLGGLLRSCASVVLSYTMHAYRPRLALSARKEMLDFSLWIMVRSFAMFLLASGDRLVLGAFFTPAVTGAFAIASSLATMAVFELVLPISRALLPGFAAKQGDQEWEKRNLKKVFGGTATIAAASGVGLSALATPAVILVYGQQFSSAGPILATLALAAAISGFNQPIAQYLTVLGRVRELAIILMLEGVATIAATYVLSARGSDIQSVTYARLAVASLALSRIFYLLGTVEAISLNDVIIAWSRPILASAAMYAALYGIQSQFPMGPAATLALCIPVGALVFSLVLLASWHLMKRPPGIEEEILTRLFKKNLQH